MPLRLLLALILLPLAVRAAGRPGVVLITVDGLGWGDFSASGNAAVPTPHLDRLLASGAVFRDFHATPLDAPSRAALLTGLEPYRAGVWGNHSGRNRLRPGVLTLAAHLQSAGWATGLFGTWALGDTHPCRPQDLGYQHVLTHPGGAPGGVADFYSNDGSDDLWLLNGEPASRRGAMISACFGEALTFIEKHSTQPFLCHISPSLPAGMDEEKLRPFRDRKEIPWPLRAAWIAELDAAVDGLLSELDLLQLTAGTLVILTSTTGVHSGGTRAGFNAGRRGLRGSPWEGGHCVPLIVRWPDGQIPAGNVTSAASMMDLLPTLAELTGCPLPAGFQPDGISLVPLLRGAATSTQRVLITDAQEIPVPVQWRLNCVMDGPWRLINGRELYDLRNDPGQRRDIAATNADTVQRLRAAGDAWWNKLTPGSLEPVRHTVGGPQDPVLLTPRDWLARGSKELTRDEVLRGVPANGQWLLNVVTEGNYDILLRRWPLTVNRTLSDGFFVPDKARLRAGTVDETKPVPAGATGVNFRIALKPGPAALQTWLTGADKTSGAYFVEIRRAVEVRSAKPVPQPR